MPLAGQPELDIRKGREIWPLADQLELYMYNIAKCGRQLINQSYIHKDHET